jgi:hypothetical protein
MCGSRSSLSRYSCRVSLKLQPLELAFWIVLILIMRKSHSRNLFYLVTWFNALWDRRVRGWSYSERRLSQLVCLVADSAAASACATRGREWWLTKTVATIVSGTPPAINGAVRFSSQPATDQSHGYVCNKTRKDACNMQLGGPHEHQKKPSSQSLWYTIYNFLPIINLWWCDKFLAHPP